MKTFHEFLQGKIDEFKIKGIVYRPNCIPAPLPKTGFRNSGPGKMSLFAVISPSRPYKPIFRIGRSQAKSQIMNKKH